MYQPLLLSVDCKEENLQSTFCRMGDSQDFVLTHAVSECDFLFVSGLQYRRPSAFLRPLFFLVKHNKFVAPY